MMMKTIYILVCAVAALLSACGTRTGHRPDSDVHDANDMRTRKA